MIQERYNDKSKLITDVNKFQLTNETEVVIYQEDERHNDVAVDLEGQAERFEELKPLIKLVAENLCKMDCIAQKYDKSDDFTDNFEAAYIYFDSDMPDKIILTYDGTTVNTEFDVVFQYTEGAFLLKSFGMVKDIPADWDSGIL